MTPVTINFVFTWPFLRLHVCFHHNEPGYQFHSSDFVLKAPVTFALTQLMLQDCQSNTDIRQAHECLSISTALANLN